MRDCIDAEFAEELGERVVKAGSEFWSDALAWGQARRLLSPKETGILDVAARALTRTPTDKESSQAVKILAKLNSEGYPEELTASP